MEVTVERGQVNEGHFVRLPGQFETCASPTWHPAPVCRETKFSALCHFLVLWNFQPSLMLVACFKHSRAHSALRRHGLGVINMNFAARALSTLSVIWAVETFLSFKHEWLSCSRPGCSESSTAHKTQAVYARLQSWEGSY